MSATRRIALLVTGFVLLAVVAGFLLPTAWHVERSVVVAAPVAKVFPYLNSLRRWPEWTVWSVNEPGVQIEYSGPEAGVGATSRWRGRDGHGAIKIMHSDSDRRIEYQLLFDGGEFAMQGILLLVPGETGTTIVWRAGGSAGRNPVERYFALWVSRRVGRDFEDSLARLKSRLEVQP